MGDKRPSYHRRQTKPLPRAELAPVSRPPPPPDQDDIATKVRCPLCAGQGMVPPEIASTFECLCAKAKEQT